MEAFSPSKVGGHSRPPLKIPVPKTWVNLGLEGDSIASIDGAVSREIGDTMTAVIHHTEDSTGAASASSSSVPTPGCLAGLRG